MKRKLQVFVSSTYTDLLDERQAAVAAILKAGHMPAGMELFTAGDQSQLETIQRWIDECDIYLLILGARYGSIEPISNLSYTEVEYDYAASKGKPLFSIVATEKSIDEKVKVFGRDVLESDNPKQLKDFRGKVLKNMSSFYEDTKDIRLSIYESLKSYENDKRIIGWVPASAASEAENLREEVASLKIENAKLKLAAEKAKNVQAVASTNEEKIKDTMKILLDQNILGPAKLINEKSDKAISLFELFMNNKEIFVNGVSSYPTENGVNEYFFHTISPKLKIHGIIDVEKITGTAHRRAIVSKFGLEFLAGCQKMLNVTKVNANPASTAEV